MHLYVDNQHKAYVMRMWLPGAVRSWNHVVVLVWCVWLLASRGVSSSKQTPTQTPNQTHTNKTPTVSAPQLLTGKICCVDHNKASPATSANNNACSDSTLSKDFSPLIYFNRSTHIPSDQIATWTPEHLDCNAGYYLEYVNFNGTLDSVLFVKENTILLSYPDTYHKVTADLCMEKRAAGDYYAGICRPNLTKLCEDTTCVTKCCGPGEVLSLRNGSTPRCLPVPSSSFLHDMRASYENPDEPPNPPNTVVSHVPTCPNAVELHPYRDVLDNFYLMTDGRLYVEAWGQSRTTEQYCIETNAVEGAIMALACVDVPEPESAAIRVKNILQEVGVSISVVFLFITVVLHIAISELRDVQGLCLLSHMLALLIADVALFTSYLFTDHLAPVHCVINALGLQYFFLAAFFWLNVMCFDIWRVIRATVNLIPLKNDQRKFRLYSLYSWGVPGVIAIITLAMHVTPLKPNVTTPGFGRQSCWFSGDIELLAYFYGFVSFLFAVNLVFLLHTMWMLYNAGGAFQCCVRQDLRGTSFNRTHVQAFWQRFTLFLVMALCWVTEVLSWKIPPKELWIATDVLNSLQGFMVFVVVIVSKKKRKVIRNAWNNTVKYTVRKLSSSAPESTAVTFHNSTSTDDLSSPRQYGSTGNEESKQGTTDENGKD